MASRSYFYATLCCWILLGSWCPSEEELDNVLDGKSSRSANFIEIHHHFLRSPEILLVKTVRDSLQCAQHCLVIKTCRSFNFGLEADSNGKHLCQLLPWDKFQHSGRYEPSSAFHHYRIAIILQPTCGSASDGLPCGKSQSVCENDPCQYGSKCIPVHRTMGYECQCPPQQIGDICQFKVPLWLKVNTREVCFGARNDSFGSFRMQFRGKITSMRLVHLSGNVTCDSTQPNYYSYWGCQNNDRLRTIVTDSRNSRVFPSQTDSKRFYTLHGIKSFSDKLTFYNLTIPLKVEIGQEFRVWYIEDFRNEFESNNNGKTCADVYALYV